jgi:hypothetical protein
MYHRPSYRRCAACALMGVTTEFVRFTRLSLLARFVISSLPAACQQHKFRRKRITDQRRVRALSPYSHIFASVLTASPIHSRIIGGLAPSSRGLTPSASPVLVPIGHIRRGFLCFQGPDGDLLSI